MSMESVRKELSALDPGQDRFTSCEGQIIYNLLEQAIPAPTIARVLAKRRHNQDGAKS